MSSCLQTTEVVFPHSPIVFMTFDYAPVPPIYFSETTAYRFVIETADDSQITWDFKQGFVSKLTPDGTHYRWWMKPTMATAVSWRNHPNIGTFPTVQFHKDGSVTSHCFGANYYWSASFDRDPEKGKVLTAVSDTTYDDDYSCSCHYCTYKNHYDDDYSEDDGDHDDMPLSSPPY